MSEPPTDAEASKVVAPDAKKLARAITGSIMSQAAATLGAVLTGGLLFKMFFLPSVMVDVGKEFVSHGQFAEALRRVEELTVVNQTNLEELLEDLKDEVKGLSARTLEIERRLPRADGGD